MKAVPYDPNGAAGSSELRGNSIRLALLLKGRQVPPAPGVIVRPDSQL